MDDTFLSKDFICPVLKLLTPPTPYRNVATGHRARHCGPRLFPLGLQAIQHSEQGAFVLRAQQASSTPNKLSRACPHPHDSHSVWLQGGELPACSEQVILEEKLIWQSPASSSFSLPAQGGGGELSPSRPV